MKTNFAFNSPVSKRRMTSVEPAWRIRPTMPSADTGLGHLVSSPSAESVPTQGSCIAKDRTALVVRLCSVVVVKEFVVGTFYERFHNGEIAIAGDRAF